MKNLKLLATGVIISTSAFMSRSAPLFSEHNQKADAVLAQMTLDEKIGQMVQVDSGALKDKA